jgi:ABC-type dipeptide/oligopeptide/nickel transport system permease component
VIRYLRRRLWNTVLVLFGFTLFLFLLLRLAPGSPVALLLPEQHTTQQIQDLTHELGLDRPLYVQYFDFLSGIVHGQLGDSIAYQTSAFPLVYERLPATIELSACALLLTTFIALPLGVLMGVKRRSRVDRAGTLITLVGVSTPVFWLGALLIILFAVKFQLFQVSGRGEPLLPALGSLFTGDTHPIRDSLSHLALPTLTLAAFEMAFLSRIARASVLEELGQPYVRAARARGLPYPLVIFKHVNRNALMPVITILGLEVGTLMGGAVITERVFAWPGVGQLLFQSVTGRDYPLAQAGILLIGGFVILVNLLVDIAYGWIDPRVRYG